jgi:LPS sulfotransferase NodH
VLLLRQGEIVKTLDGNRRVIRAVVYERETIDAWVGTLAATERPRNYWVTTGYLRELVRLAEEKESDELTTAVSKVLETLFNESEIARVNFRLRSMKPGSFGEKIGKKLGL